MKSRTFKHTVLIVQVFMLVGIAFSCTTNSEPANDSLTDLGRYLFHDRRLSVNKTKACASCHAQEFSFTDGYNRSIGAHGDLLQRNARPLINLSDLVYFTAADSSIKLLEQQIRNPMFNTHPVELGIKGNEQTILERIENDPRYQKMFKVVFPADSKPISIENIIKAVVAFEKTISSKDSKYDKYAKGDSAALNLDEKLGLSLFFSKQLQCATCHGGPNFSTPEIKKMDGTVDFYHNIGLYNIGGSYPVRDPGLEVSTGSKTDNGKFRVPTLRNLAFTAPYFHDGSALNLEQVLDVYQQGGRVLNEGDQKGDGRIHPAKSPLIQGFQLTLQERQALLKFLFALTDSSIINNQAYANPFVEDETKR